MPSTRRALLASIVAGTVAVAGCSTRVQSPSPDDPPPAGVDELPEPDDHIFGANGSWSSFGCNASNTRAVADGKAPVDGVSERWRVDVSQLTQQAPVVADGRVFQPDQRTLRVLDADDGSTLWTLENVRSAPILRDGVAYAAVGNAICALEPDTGDVLWDREFDVRGTVAPVTRTRRGVVCAAGEAVVSLDPDDGTEQWRRDVFGQVLVHAATSGTTGVVVATRAGLVYLFDDAGTAYWRWELPGEPIVPPTAGRDGIYVACRDGTTYALTHGERDPIWTAETGRVERGIGVVDGHVLVANGRELHALDADSGDRYWERAIGDWPHTAPAYGRDTVFVGGDRLYAFDPTPGDRPDDGPALRFDRAFDGRVGPGPVLDDGTLYVIAIVEGGATALLALE